MVLEAKDINLLISVAIGIGGTAQAVWKANVYHLLQISIKYNCYLSYH